MRLDTYQFVHTELASSKLLREMRSKRLISTRVFVGWLVDLLGIANLAQIGFVAQLIGDFLPEISKHASVARSCIRIACSKLSEVSHPPGSSVLSSSGRSEVVRPCRPWLKSTQCSYMWCQLCSIPTLRCC